MYDKVLVDCTKCKHYDKETKRCGLMYFTEASFPPVTCYCFKLKWWYKICQFCCSLFVFVILLGLGWFFFMCVVD